MEEQNTTFEKVNSWVKHSIMLKLATITILMLLLLIPTSMITSVIYERESLNVEAMNEVSGKWGGSQIITGPILTIPLVYEYLDKEKNATYQTQVNWYILPEELNIKGDVTPEKLKRGIYEIAVYKSDLTLSGKFNFEKNIDQTNLKQIKYDQAFITIGIKDLRGIKDHINFNWNKEAQTVKPGSKISDVVYAGMTINVPNIEEYLNTDIPFDYTLKLQGSQNMSFIPLGSTTNVKLKSNWDTPSFDGSFLPDNREVTETGFTADWKVLNLNRNFPQSWTQGEVKPSLESSMFGVNFLMPMDDYQKSTRSAKYAVMTIALTFLIFFLVEVLNGKKIHPFQYALVGLALCLFYILLVSISEHSNFNFAYGLSAAGIVSMITLYSMSVFKAKKLTLLLVTTLSGIYGFLFVTLQLADYALLMGSIGLTVILAATMYFTRNINWYKLNIETE